MAHPFDLHPLKDVACNAWNAVKQPQQPEYEDLPIAFKSKLLDRAKHAKSGASIEEDDSPMAKFERAVIGEIPTEVKEELAEEVIVESTEAQVEVQLEAEETPESAEEPDKPEETEEKEPLEPKGPLPDDFPARDKLHAAGVNTYGQLAKTEDVTVIDGIGVGTAKTIAKRVKAETRKLNK